MNWNELFQNYKTGLGNSIDLLIDPDRSEIATMDGFSIRCDGHRIGTTNRASINLKISGHGISGRVNIDLNFINNVNNKIAILMSLQHKKENISDNRSDYLTKSGDGCIWKNEDSINSWNLKPIQKKDFYSKYFPIPLPLFVKIVVTCLKRPV